MTTDGLRAYWRGLIIAAAVSMRQLGELPYSGRIREAPPYVLLQEQPDHDRFAPAERIGSSILTVPLESTSQHSKN
jgi:hypothetical protein